RGRQLFHELAVDAHQPHLLRWGGRGLRLGHRHRDLRLHHRHRHGRAALARPQGSHPMTHTIRAARPRLRTRGWWWKSALVLAIGAFYLLPLFISFNVALRPSTDTRSLWELPTDLYLGNFIEAFASGGIGRAALNSIIITATSIVIIAVVGAFAAYPLARRRTRTNVSIKALVLGVMMVPPLSILVSLYATMVDLGGVSTYWGIVLMLVTFELPLAIFIFSNFISAIPVALDEA